MDHGGWIDLHAFAAKFGISLSTLRRRIRAKSIEFKLERGRYWLPDTLDVMSAAPLFSRKGEDLPPRQNVVARDFTANASSELHSLEIENRKLKSQLAELETLVRALESELEETQNSNSLDAPRA
ncbi:MAG: hypothetical protein ABIR96_02595 [Bdellovibrionota bacterium]